LFARDSVLIEAGNPKIGYPWASVGGHGHNFYEDESNDVRVDSEPSFSFMWSVVRISVPPKTFM
jgi:hypothetical protein